MANVSAPGLEPELTTWGLSEKWTQYVDGKFGQAVAEASAKHQGAPWVFNPLTGPPDATKAPPFSWTAFPKSQDETFDKYRVVDGNRSLQDEYCEWAVKRDDKGRILRVTFTTETPDYYQFLAETDPESFEHVVSLYQKYVDPEVQAVALRGQGGAFERMNGVNFNNPDGVIMHMGQQSNNLYAAIALAALAAWPAVDRDGRDVTDGVRLTSCLGTGVDTRHSDPRITAEVNRLVRAGRKVTLADPPGLYIDRIDLSGFTTPDGSDIRSWVTRNVRGSAGFEMRAVFAAPEGSKRFVSELLLDDEPVETGGQIAEKIDIRLDIASASTMEEPLKPKTCA